MPDMIKVRAVPGLLCPLENARGHVGWRAAQAGEEADHAIPGIAGLKRIDGDVEVPNTVYYRRAIECGDRCAKDVEVPASVVERLVAELKDAGYYAKITQWSPAEIGELGALTRVLARGEDDADRAAASLDAIDTLFHRGHVDAAVAAYNTGKYKESMPTQETGKA